MRSHCVRTKEEKEAFKLVIEEFFVFQDGFYHHETCDQVLNEIYDKSEKARASAKARWDKKNANASKTQCERKANGMLPITYNLLPNKNNSNQDQKIPYSKIKDSFNEILGEALGKVRAVTDERKRHIKARINEDEEKRISVDWWAKYFNAVSKVDFLIGNGQINHNTGREWKASFDWLLNQNNMTKILEGKYS